MKNSKLWSIIGFSALMMKRLLFLLLASGVLSSCSTQHLITGEPLIYGIAPNTGQVLDRDTPDLTNTNLVTPHKGEIITLVLNNAFIKYLRDVGSPHVLVYTQVFDDGTDDPDTAITKVLYNERNSPKGVNLGLADRVVYGPTAYKGFPLRIRLFIVELDKEEKALASKIIDTVGTTAATVKPEAAPAIEVAMRIAKALNAMNEDDFELRFDLTLYPVAPIGRFANADANLDASPQEPSQRTNRLVTMVSPLRTGFYAIMKRELEERFVTQTNAPVPEASIFDMDYSQQFFMSGYQNEKSEKFLVNEVLRYQGGYLYRIITGITDEKGKSKDGVVVRPKTGPNRNTDLALSRGIRLRFTDRTYVVISVVTGLPLGLDQEALKAASARDTRQLAKLLDNPTDASLSERIGPEVDAIAKSLKSALEQRRIAEQAARRAGRDPSFRASPEYPVFWAQQIDPLPAAPGTVERSNAEAKNAATLEVLSDLLINLPILSPTNQIKMTILHDLSVTNVVTLTNTPGIFRLSEEFKNKLK